MKFLKVLKIMIIVIAGSCVLGFLLMHLWNWLMPGIFGLKTITFVQALGLFVLSKILLGGIHRHSGGRRGWKRHMNERWSHMSHEDRERFRAGMRGHRKCGFGSSEEPRTEQASS